MNCWKKRLQTIHSEDRGSSRFSEAYNYERDAEMSQGGRSHLGMQTVQGMWTVSLILC
jgi:hypothetical protein